MKEIYTSPVVEEIGSVHALTLQTNKFDSGPLDDTFYKGAFLHASF